MGKNAAHELFSNLTYGLTGPHTHRPPQDLIHLREMLDC